MKNFSLKWRIVAPMAGVLIIGIGIIVAIIAVSYSNAMTKAVNDNLEATAYQYANRIKADLEMSLGSVKSLKSVISDDVGTSHANREYFVGSMKKVVLENDRLFGVWCAFEPNAFDGKDAEYANKAPLNDATGRFVPYLFMKDATTIGEDRLVDYDKPGAGDYYLVPRERKRETMVPPYYYEAGGVSQYICSVAEPILQKNATVGVVGGDLRLQPICDYLQQVKLFKSGFLTLLDQNGNIVFHPEKSNWMKPAGTIFSETTVGQIRKVGESGAPVVYSVRNPAGVITMNTVCPLDIGDTGNRWVMLGVVPASEAMASVRYGVTLTILIGAAVLLLSLVLLYFQVASVTRVLTSINDRISTASISVYEASGSIASASGSLAEGATEQASSLEETSSALEEMASMTRQNADNATRTNDTNLQNNKLIADGAVAVQNMSEAMASINDSAEKISRIIKTIEEIAFQTNLLALNAAVEAARAGEAGKGFAVVADEVRNLAGRSAQAAKDTTELISGTVERVRNGTEIAGQLDGSFKEIEEGARTVAKLISEIASATGEQAQGVDQVNTAVAQMDKVTQQNAANAEETASVTENLSAQAEELNHLVGELSRLITGVAGEPVAQVAPPPRAPAARGPNHSAPRMLPYGGGKG